MSTLLYFIHILAIVLWVGGIVTLAFIDTQAIFSTLPKEQAGEVVGVIFPKFFLMGVVCISIALITSYFIGFSQTPFEKIKFFILIFMLLLSLFSNFYILPKTRSIKMEKKQVEDKHRLEQLTSQFKKIHMLSVILLMVNLLSGLVVIFLVSKQMQLAILKN